MAALSRDAARELIDDIKIKNGGIDAEDRANTPQSVLNSLSSLRRQLAKATST